MRVKNRKFYKSQEDFRQIYLGLKQTTCPHCKLSGYLNLHGYLRGYDEKTCAGKVIRGHRIFCSNRNKRRGCGRTFSILALNILKKFIIRAYSLWKFLKNIAQGKDKKRSLSSLKVSFSTSSVYRLWKRFCLAQTKIRMLLLRLCCPPILTKSRQPAIQTILHLKSAFRNTSCPISAFQDYFQAYFL